MIRAALWMVLASCAGPDEPMALVLDGPSQLRVDKLGPVEAPAVLLESGERPEGLQVAVADSRVATLEGRRIIARAPGETQVSATLGDQEVVWTLVVDPAIRLRFVDSPATVAMGEGVALEVEARIGDQVVESPQAIWLSSDETVLTIANGQLSTHAVGVAYVTAKLGASQAMIEIEVTE